MLGNNDSSSNSSKNFYVLNTWCELGYAVESISEFCSTRGSTMHKTIIAATSCLAYFGMAGSVIRISQGTENLHYAGWAMVLAGFLLLLLVGMVEVNTFNTGDIIHTVSAISYIIFVHTGMILVDRFSNVNIATFCIGFSAFAIYAVLLRGLLHLGREKGNIFGLGFGPGERINFPVSENGKRLAISWIMILTEAVGLITPVIAVAVDWLRY